MKTRPGSAATANRWAILTGEYPPQPGGVADYTALVARGLAAAGDAVTVFAPPAAGPDLEALGVVVRRLPSRFGARALAELDRALHRWPGRILLQYTPHAFGWKAMNVPLCAWLWARRQALDVMFHEVAFPFVPGQPWRHKALAAVNRGMTSLLLRASERVFVSIPGWEPMLRPLARRYPAPIWTPIPSNLPTECSPAEVAEVRCRLAPRPGDRLVGHFGSYASAITQLLEPVLGQLLNQAPDVHLVLLGNVGRAFADALARKHPDLGRRWTATGPLDARSAGAHVAACDVLLQPYPDGISTRRTSAMAGLALGRPTVTTAEYLTEPFWQATRAVEIAPPEGLAAAVLALLADPDRRAEIGRRAAELYRSRFALEHTIRVMREPVTTSAERNGSP